ncbi:MAG: GNAT family N-acetyltransferase [Pseudomonadales bacterium]|nr:GNAT family N-acetyltransferase [Pseudomonadales bacterium]
MEGIKLIELSAESCVLLNQVASEVFDFAVDPIQLAAFIEDPRHVMVLAVKDRWVVGMGSAVEYFHPDKPPQLWINEVGVGVDYRGHRIGVMITEWLIHRAKALECSAVWLATEADNASAERCYQRVQPRPTSSSVVMYDFKID